MVSRTGMPSRSSFRARVTVSEDDDASAMFFFSRENAIVVAIQPPPNFLVGLLPMTILESLNVHARSVLFAEMLYQLDCAVNCIVVLDEAADKADHHGRRLGRYLGRDHRIRRICLGAGYGGQREKTENASQGR